MGIRIGWGLLGVLFIPLALAADPEGAGVVGQLEQSGTTTPAEKAEFARSALQEMEDAVERVQKLYEQADRESAENKEELKDCLQKKLTPMQAMVDVSRASSASMQSALGTNDMVHADQEFRKIAVALSKTREFLTDALSCGGSTGGDKARSVSTLTRVGEDYAEVTDTGDDESFDPQPDFGTDY